MNWPAPKKLLVFNPELDPPFGEVFCIYTLSLKTYHAPFYWVFEILIQGYDENNDHIEDLDYTYYVHCDMMAQAYATQSYMLVGKAHDGFTTAFGAAYDMPTLSSCLAVIIKEEYNINVDGLAPKQAPHISLAT